MADSLLAEFVELAPKEWGAEIEGDEVHICIDHDRIGCSYELRFEPLGKDMEGDDPQAIIFLWDYLEEQCGGTMLWREESRWGVSHHTDDAYWGTTRIETLVRACIALWKAKPAPLATEAAAETETQEAGGGE